MSWPLRCWCRLGGNESVLPAAVVANRKVLPIPLLPMALQPALWDGPYKGALAGVVEMLRGSMLEAAGRVRVGGESTHGVVTGSWWRCLVCVLECLCAGSHADADLLGDCQYYFREGDDSANLDFDVAFDSSQHMAIDSGSSAW